MLIRALRHDGCFGRLDAANHFRELTGHLINTGESVEELILYLTHTYTSSKDRLECTALLALLSECHWTRDVCIHTHPIKPFGVAVIWLPM